MTAPVSPPDKSFFSGLSLDEVWRYALAGGVLLSSLAWMADVPASALLNPSASLILVGLVGAFATGSIISALFRATIHQPLQRNRIKKAVNRAPLEADQRKVLNAARTVMLPAGYSLLDLHMDLCRWRDAATNREIRRSLGHWAAQIQALYTSSLALSVAASIALLACAAHVTTSPPSVVALRVGALALIAAVLLTAGLRSHLRHAIAEVRHVSSVAGFLDDLQGDLKRLKPDGTEQT